MKRACIGHGRVGCSKCRRPAWRQTPPANRYAYGSGWATTRKRVLERDGYQCQLRDADICLGKASQVDHIVQPEAGGTNALENLRAVCRRCHARRTGRQGALAKQRAAQRRNPR
jgi:5-methylcytosine-specific restriction protein A